MGSDKDNGSGGGSGSGKTLAISDDYLQNDVQNRLDAFITAVTSSDAGFPDIQSFASLAASGGTPGGDMTTGYTGVLPGNSGISTPSSGLPQQAQLLKSHFATYAGTLFNTIDGLTTSARTLKQNTMNVKSVLDDGADQSNLTANEMLADMQNVSVIPSSGGAGGLTGGAGGLSGGAGGLTGGGGGTSGGSSSGGVGGAQSAPTADTTGSGGSGTTSGTDTTSSGGVGGTQTLLSTGGGGSAGVAPSIGVPGKPLGSIGSGLPTGVARSIGVPGKPLGSIGSGLPTGVARSIGVPGEPLGSIGPARSAEVIYSPGEGGSGSPVEPPLSGLTPTVMGSPGVPMTTTSPDISTPAVQGAPAVTKPNVPPGTTGSR
jgi:hypothetical protein